jgi:hypothetical protein
VSRDDVGADRDGSLDERVLGGLPLALAEGFDPGDDGKTDNDGRKNQK